MSLNIKNEHVHALAREAARLTGKSQTSVIEEALERLLAEHRRRESESARNERLDQVFAAIDAREISESHQVETHRLMDDLYDDSGLPR